MIKNYLKVALRNIRKHKGFFFINAVGLSIGIVCSVLILLFVVHELSYDKFFDKSDRIYRLAVRASIGDTKIHQTYSSSETFRKLMEDFPEIELGVKFLNLGRTPVILNEKTFYESRFFALDATFYEIFSIPMIFGDSQQKFFEMGLDSQPPGLAGSMVCDEQVAAEFCLSNRSVLVDVCSGCRACSFCRANNCQFPDGQGRAQKSCGFPEIRMKIYHSQNGIIIAINIHCMLCV